MSKSHLTKTAIYFLIVGYVGALTIYNIVGGLVSYADCPACFKNETPMAAHPGEQGQRPFYSIYVDPQTVTNVNVAGALPGAMSGWNGAQGTGGTTTPITFREWDNNPQQIPQVIIKVGPLGTSKKGEKECATLSAQRYKNDQKTIINYVITLPPEAANWTQARIQEVLEHELGHVLGVHDVNQGCDSIMQQGNSDCSASVHTTIEPRDVDAARKYANDRTHCDKERKVTNQTGTDGGGGDDPCGGDPNCGDPCGGDPYCGDPCGGDPYCGDPCQGDPCCGNGEVEVCTQFCWYETVCTAYDDCGNCYWEEEWRYCDPPDCHWECR